MSLIYHITARSAWEAAQAEGFYRVESLETEGFIHASTIHQVMWVANKFYAGQSGLVLLCIETDDVQPEVRFEDPAHPGGGQVIETSGGGQLFPHIYGALNTGAVTAVYDFPLQTDGSFRLPDGL